MAGVQIDITGDASKATAALNGIASMAESVAERIRNGFQQRIGQRMFDGLAEGAREAFSKVVEGVKSALDAGSELTDQIARTGASGKNLVILGQAFKNAGMEASNIGPSLKGYGKLRGNSEAVVKYTWGKIWNTHAYNACSQMPRFGHMGILDETQIRHVMALLLDPKSPVNQ